VRIAAALLLAAALLPSCGGDGDDSTDAVSGPTITSDDGRATLALPAGVDGDGVSVRAIDLEGAAAAYELLPSPTRFSAPATLTIEDVQAPEDGALPIALSIADDGMVEALNVDAMYDDDDGLATIELVLGHLGTAGVWYPGAGGSDALVTAGVDAPEAVVVGEPFDVAVRAARLGSRFVIPRNAGEIVLDVGPVVTSGSLDATNAVPSEVRDVPSDGPLTDFRGEGTFTCRAVGTVEVTWALRLSIETHATAPDGRTTDRLTDSDLHIQEHPRCEEAS
jgi:hypothetical protein